MLAALMIGLAVQSAAEPFRLNLICEGRALETGRISPCASKARIVRFA